MAAPSGLRGDFDATALRTLAKVSRDPDQLLRLPSLAEIYDGGSRGDAARVGPVRLAVEQALRAFAIEAVNPCEAPRYAPRKTAIHGCSVFEIHREASSYSPASDDWLTIGYPIRVRRNTSSESSSVAGHLPAKGER